MIKKNTDDHINSIQEHKKKMCRQLDTCQFS